MKRTRISIIDRRGIIPFLFVLFLSFQIRSQTSFDINDPRNPNCPCHKYQKLADEEYAKSIRAGNQGIGEFVGKANSREDKIHKERFEKYRKQKRSKHDKRIREPRWLYEFRHCGLLKKPKHPIKCPIWNNR